MKARLLKPHTHAGKQYAAGDEIEIDRATATWLAERKVIAPAAAIHARPATTEERTK